MATSITEIYDSILSYKDSREELKDLNSTSLVAIYTMWAYVTSVVIFTHETLWDLLETAISQRINGTSAWYALRALEYQHGDTLQVLNEGTSLGYDPIIAENQIVTRAAYEDSAGTLNLKLATGSAGSLSALTGAERSGVEKYIDDIKFAGSQINVVSIDADQLILTSMAVYHDGVRTSDEVRVDLDLAMDSFFENLDFNGVFYIEQFRDSLQSVVGVIDVSITSLSMRDNTNPSVPVDTVITRKVTLASGYGEVLDKTALTVSIES